MDAETEAELQRIALVAYVAGFGGMSPAEAEHRLDVNSPIGTAWRETPLPTAGHVEVEQEDNDE